MLGVVAVEGLHAQAKPPAYLTAEAGIADPDGYAKEFLPPVLKTIQEGGGHFLAPGRYDRILRRGATCTARRCGSMGELGQGAGVVELAGHQGRFRHRQKICDVPPVRS